MKQCPRCSQTYSDDQLNFCLEDGELLTAYATEPPPTRYADDAPPTVVLNEARVTNPANWHAGPLPPSTNTPVDKAPVIYVVKSDDIAAKVPSHGPAKEGVDSRPLAINPRGTGVGPTAWPVELVVP